MRRRQFLCTLTHVGARPNRREASLRPGRDALDFHPRGLRVDKPLMIEARKHAHLGARTQKTVKHNAATVEAALLDVRRHTVVETVMPWKKAVYQATCQHVVQMRATQQLLRGNNDT